MPFVLLALQLILTAILVNGCVGWLKHDLLDPWVQRIIGGILSIAVVVLLGLEPGASGILILTFNISLAVSVVLAGASMLIGHITNFKKGPPVTLPLAVITMCFSLFVTLAIGIYYRFGPGA